MNKNKFDCIVIGGGATGAGIVRDLSLRGLKVILLEKNDLSEGTTGRCHAMLHSGARYVFKDKEAASECALENKILLKIAPHITEACGGFFMGVTDEDMEYGDTFNKKCKEAGVWCKEIDPDEFLKIEPNCSSNTKRVFQVKDGYIDPFLLTLYNALDAKLHGAQIKTYCKVINLIINKNDILGVKYFNRLKNKRESVFADIIVNATGPWASYLEKDLKLVNPLKIAPTMGTLIVIKDRLVNHLINRLRKPGDGDIFVPSHQSVILGTTSKLVEFKQLDNLLADRQELEYILNLGEEMIPTIKKHRMIRFYSGARPLIASGAPLREASRKFDIIDYENEGYNGFITIFGGKLTTYRLMAEKTSDLICKKLGFKIESETSELALPGGESKVPIKIFRDELHVDDKTAFDMHYKWGTFYKEIFDLCDSCLDSYTSPGAPRTICECENVTEPELNWAFQNLDVKVIDDYRRRTRQGMGPCQGQFCFYKVANLEAKWTKKPHSQIMSELKIALLKRWKTEVSGDDLLKRQIKLSKYIYLLGGGLE
ncbi:MAG: anaerobic glycerol-3-phosphate dehydrogenase subunit A [Candidatus Hermodarchaeota archaeon]